jgi:hypothetical protein
VDRLLITLDKNGPDCLLTRGVLGGNVEQLLRGLWLIAAELMHQGSIASAGPEGRDDISVTDFGELMTFLGEPSNVIPEGLIRLHAPGFYSCRQP